MRALPILWAMASLPASWAVDTTPQPSSAQEPSAPTCPRLPIFAAGREIGGVCRDDAAAQGLTIIALADGWTPRALRDAPELGPAGRQPYLQTYLRLAAASLDEAPARADGGEDRFLELYGISPTFTALRSRLLDEERHRCHDAVAQSDDGAALSALLREEATITRSQRLRAQIGAVRALEGHLRCDGFLRGPVTGLLDRDRVQGLRAYQRLHMIVGPRGLDAETRAALAAGSRELDYRALLRALRERVADAAGLIEDGSACDEAAPVAGRDLDTAAFRTAARRLPRCAPDLVAQATDQAARALGWTSPETATAFLSALPAPSLATLQVAIRLPPPPAYHSPNMDLRVEIDRGDVWYDHPHTASGRRRAQPITERPALTLYARDPTGEVALLRWSTTIGGWQAERLPGGVALRYKNSDVGPRVWRHVVASPAWLPPPTTPEREMVRRGPGGWQVKTELFNPGYQNAYGLVMMIHERDDRRPGEEAPDYMDLGIRTHGSVNYPSILGGTSHGCHRLFNHLALRLSSFLLRHRPHVIHGALDIDYERRFTYRGQRQVLRVGSRGYRYELTPPVPVAVLEGRVRGRAPLPLKAAYPLPPSSASRR